MRVYMYGTGTPEDKETNDMLLNIASETIKAKDSLSEEEYGCWIVALYNRMRENMGLPNKIFTIQIDKEHTKAEFIFFDKEPNGKYYEVFDEERENGFVPYIEVEE